MNVGCLTSVIGHDHSTPMSEETAKTGWSALLRPAWLPAVAVLVGGVLLHSMNVLVLWLTRSYVPYFHLG